MDNQRASEHCIRKLTYRAVAFGIVGVCCPKQLRLRSSKESGLGSEDERIKNTCCVK